MPPPLAYFLTWTCHATRLHGDDRGSVDRYHNKPGRPFLAPDPARADRERRSLTAAPRTLDPRARDIIAATIRQHCELRAWRLLALNVRTNHVHVVVDCRASHSPEDAMEQLKAWCTRKLREAGLASSDEKVWTEHASTRWIDSPESLADAIDYVLNRQ